VPKIEEKKIPVSEIFTYAPFLTILKKKIA